jgi:hypothetical protein
MYLTLFFLALLIVVFRKKIVYYTFMVSFPFFEKHQAIGEFLGVEYKRSSEWSTSRKHTGLLFFQSSILNKVTGFNLKLGDIEFIKSFKHRQRNPIAEFQITLKKGERSLLELEREIMILWHYQLKDCYQIPIAEDEKILEVLLENRRQVGQSSGFMRLVQRFVDILYSKRDKYANMKAAFANMTEEEKALYYIPFLTTIDTFMLCLAYKTYGNQLTDFFDRLPVKYVPMYTDGKPVLCRLDNNMKNNPGNSLFGPTGVVCPGSHVTTQIVYAIKEFCNNNTWEITGTPVQNNNMISGIKNLDEVFINIL